VGLFPPISVVLHGVLVPVLSLCVWAQCRKGKNAPLEKLLVEIEREWSIVWLCAWKGQAYCPCLYTGYNVWGIMYENEHYAAYTYIYMHQRTAHVSYGILWRCFLIFFGTESVLEISAALTHHSTHTHTPRAVSVKVLYMGAIVPICDSYSNLMLSVVRPHQPYY
jgi:hypothetical protein